MRRLLALAAALAVLASCTSAQVAGTFKSWCRHAEGCTVQPEPR